MIDLCNGTVGIVQAAAVVIMIILMVVFMTIGVIGAIREYYKD
jgi:hypothetical protein